MYGENPCEALERREGIVATCSAFVLPWSHGAGGWDDEPISGSESGWGGAGKGRGGENRGGGQGDQVCGPFLVVLSVDLWKAASEGAVEGQSRHANSGYEPAESERAASSLEGEPLRLVLGSNRCVGRWQSSSFFFASLALGCADDARDVQAWAVTYTLGRGLGEQLR